MPRCHISLGGNVGPVGETFDKALDRLRSSAGCAVLGVSPYHDTTPVGDAAGGRFLNAAAEIETRLAPLDLLTLLQSIETEMGRKRTRLWEPRTLDLDLVFYDSEIINMKRLAVPHPAAWYRRFVLDPLAEIAPRFVHPQKHADIQTLRQRLLGRPIRVAFSGSRPDSRSDLIRTLERAFPAVNFFDWDAVARSAARSAAEPALIFWLGPRSRYDLFHQLPPLPRLDVALEYESAAHSIRHVIQSALG